MVLWFITFVINEAISTLVTLSTIIVPRSCSNEYNQIAPIKRNDLIQTIMLYLSRKLFQSKSSLTSSDQEKYKIEECKNLSELGWSMDRSANTERVKSTIPYPGYVDIIASINGSFGNLQ
ncbi:hypothetical protein Glove_286g1 [Diversispora epigaea]|uniref:Uncharacterized protein n=1 Tax=Diversispora epigaea TaxID=1348612 RepID=A0A397I8P5_9GLOM|nr:hypothetical protein Glove_286g1 [Diversispora epigaea]